MVKPVLLFQTISVLVCTALWGGWVFGAFHLGWIYAAGDGAYTTSTLFAVGVLGIAVSGYGWPLYCRQNPETDSVRFRSGFFGALLLAMGIAFGVLKGHWYSTVSFGSLGACLLMDYVFRIRLLQDLRSLKWLGALLVPAVILIYLTCWRMEIRVLSALNINLMPMRIPIEHFVLALPVTLLPVLLTSLIGKLLQRVERN